MTGQTSFISLRNTLAELYPDEASMRRLLADAGINAVNIALNSTPINNWQAILAEAEKLPKIDILLEVVGNEYLDNSILQEAIRACQATLPKNIGDQPSKDKPPRFKVIIEPSLETSPPFIAPPPAKLQWQWKNKIFVLLLLPLGCIAFGLWLQSTVNYPPLPVSTQTLVVRLTKPPVATTTTLPTLTATSAVGVALASSTPTVTENVLPTPTATSSTKSVITTPIPTLVFTATPLPTATSTTTASPTATLPPTRTPNFTATARSNAATQTAMAPTATFPPTSTSIPTLTTPTLTPTHTPTPQSNLLINLTANVRSGPGTTCTIIGEAEKGDYFAIKGKNGDSTWWQVEYQEKAGWIHDSIVTITSTKESILIALDVPVCPTRTPAPLPTIGSVCTDGYGIDFVFVPKGSFSMGPSGTSKIEVDNFWIMKTEVTNAQYQACVDAGKCTPSKPDLSSQGEKHPVTGITWYQANEYAIWTGGKLPTEEQWEKAARGPTDSRDYPWGSGVDNTRLNFCGINCSEVKNREAGIDDGFAKTAPVGNYPNGASPYGILDMAGNVAEWVISPTTSETLRMYRGGSFLGDVDDVHVHTQRLIDHNTAKSNVGFRVAGVTCP